jgi:hypothetical protein
VHQIGSVTGLAGRKCTTGEGGDHHDDDLGHHDDDLGPHERRI